jgi:hypothetical protein
LVVPVTPPGGHQIASVSMSATEHSRVTRFAKLHGKLDSRRGMNVLGSLVMRLRLRNFLLVCPSCKIVASAIRARYRLGDERLTCNRCGATDSVTFWRFEGIAHRVCAAPSASGIKARAPSQDGCGFSP